MQVVKTGLPDVLLLQPRRFSDPRGWLAETWNRETFRAAGVEADFVQDNVSFSALPGTVRGLHYQRPPMAQAKLIVVHRGRILDVVVDLRLQAPTYGHHITFDLSAGNGSMLFIPAGFAHGFCTLEPDVVVAYKVDAFYSPEHEASIHWQDPDLAIAWPVTSALLSAKDKAAGSFAGVEHGF